MYIYIYIHKIPRATLGTSASIYIKTIYIPSAIANVVSPVPQPKSKTWNSFWTYINYKRFQKFCIFFPFYQILIFTQIFYLWFSKFYIPICKFIEDNLFFLSRLLNRGFLFSPWFACGLTESTLWFVIKYFFDTVLLPFLSQIVEERTWPADL